jgi:hypothetical protein
MMSLVSLIRHLPDRSGGSGPPMAPPLMHSAKLQQLIFDGSQVALVVRGKFSPKHKPSILNQHADCLLANGEPVGFFGEGGPYSSGTSSASVRSMGMNLNGYVANYEIFKAKMPHYVRLELARAGQVWSTVLTIPVQPKQADTFSRYWRRLTHSRVPFHLLGANCSSYASKAFRAAGILSGPVPGLTTPDRLYDQLSTAYAGKCRSYSGYLTVLRSGDGFGVSIMTSSEKQ